MSYGTVEVMEDNCGVDTRVGRACQSALYINSTGSIRARR